MDGIKIGFKKAVSDEVQLSGGVSREHVNIPERLEQMRTFCLDWVTKKANEGLEEDEKEEEGEDDVEVVERS